MAFALAGCGGGDEGNEQSNGAAASQQGLPDVAYAKQQIAKFRAVPQFEPPGPPVDVASLKGKTIFNIPISSAVPFCTTIDQKMADIAHQAGLKFVEFRNQGQPSEFAKGIQQGINTNADIISLQCGILPETLAPQIKAAHQANIPVVASHYTDVSFPKPDLLDAAAFGRFLQAARLDVDYAIQDAGGKPVNALVLYPKEVIPAEAMVGAIKDEMKTRCGPDCKAKYINVPTARWATDLQDEVRTALVADPSINYVIPIFDSMSLFAAPGIQAAGKSGQVKLMTFNGTPPVLKLIAQADVVVMDVGESTDWLAYLNMDQMFRVLAGQKPVKKYAGPLRIIDDSTVKSTGSDFLGGFGSSYVDGYEKLWGLG